MPTRRTIMAALAALPAMPGALHAQDAGFPSRSIRLLVGFAPDAAVAWVRMVHPRLFLPADLSPPLQNLKLCGGACGLRRCESLAVHPGPTMTDEPAPAQRERLRVTVHACFVQKLISSGPRDIPTITP